MHCTTCSPPLEQIMREDDNNWPMPDRVGKQELEIKMNGEHICFNTTKLGSVLQVQQSKDPDSLRIFYYLVQVGARRATCSARAQGFCRPVCCKTGFPGFDMPACGDLANKSMPVMHSYRAYASAHTTACFTAVAELWRHIVYRSVFWAGSCGCGRLGRSLDVQCCTAAYVLHCRLLPEPCR